MPTQHYNLETLWFSPSFRYNFTYIGCRTPPLDEEGIETCGPGVDRQMPTYSYRCTACGHQFDQFQRFSDDPLRVCPACEGALKKVLHPVGVVFKGSGWYITDSRKSSGSENGSSDKADKSDGKDKVSETAKKSESADATSAPAKAKVGAATES
jgi:putative FmdB family regulatory protein